MIDKNSPPGEASIRKRGVGSKNKIPQNIGSFMESRWNKRKIHWILTPFKGIFNGLP
jgi:hypothetical protein